MSNRITEGHLNALCESINRLTSSPMETYKLKDNYKPGESNLIAQIGNYHLSFAYGGVSLHRICNESGGVTDVFGCGHTTKRDLHNRLCAYVDGIRSQRGVQ